MYQGMTCQISSESKTKTLLRVYCLDTQFQSTLQRKGPTSTASVKRLESFNHSFIPAKSASRTIKVVYSLSPTAPTYTPLPVRGCLKSELAESGLSTDLAFLKPNLGPINAPASAAMTQPDKHTMLYINLTFSYSKYKCHKNSCILIKKNEKITSSHLSF